MNTGQILHIYSCDCILEHLVQLPVSDIEISVIDLTIFSVTSSNLMFIHDDNELFFFCDNASFIIRKFMFERLSCLKRSGFFDDTCLELIDFKGVNDCCFNCLSLLRISLRKYLTKLVK